MAIPKQDILDHLCNTYTSALDPLKATEIKKQMRIRVGEQVSDPVVIPQYGDNPIRSIQFILNNGQHAKYLIGQIAEDKKLENLVGFEVKLELQWRTIKGIPFIVGTYQKEDKECIYVANGSTGWTPSETGLIPQGLPEEVFAGLILARDIVVDYLKQEGRSHSNGYLIKPENIPPPTRRYRMTRVITMPDLM
ncbi:hypothetical protein HN587_02415 [Candidatus Woesearchaeota archaeon]|nr:hypothetical protein [Candidatus Woesearchaeota archaeon]